MQLIVARRLRSCLALVTVDLVAANRDSRWRRAARAATTPLLAVCLIAGWISPSAQPATGRVALAPSFTRSWTWVEKTDGGYRYSTTLRVGTISRLSQIKTLLPGFDRARFATPCEFNSRTDALMPASLTMTNLTRGFSTTLETTSLAGSTLGYLVQDRLWLAASYSSGVQCDVMAASTFDGAKWGVKWPNPVRPGQTVGPAYAYFIIHNYYSPNHPKGDLQRLRNAGLYLRESDLSRTLVSIRGPGVAPLDRFANEAAIPLDGR